MRCPQHSGLAGMMQCRLDAGHAGGCSFYMPSIDWKQRAEQAERERDEARAKVERLTAALRKIAEDKVVCTRGMVCAGQLCFRDEARAALGDK